MYVRVIVAFEDIRCVCCFLFVLDILGPVHLIQKEDELYIATKQRCPCVFNSIPYFDA